MEAAYCHQRHFTRSTLGAASVVVGNKLYVFGGYGGSGRLADFFEYDFETKTFGEVRTAGDSPGVRENNGVVLYKNDCTYLVVITVMTG